MKGNISLVIPTKNEPYIGTLLERIRNIFHDNLEIVVIEKGKKLPIVKAKVVKQRTKGLGNAFLEATKYAHGDLIANMDGDGSHRPEDLKKMIAEMKNADLVIGSRFVRGGKTKDVQHRQIISFLTRKLASFIMGLNIEDSTSGFFVVRKEVLEKLKIKAVLGYKIIFPLAYKAQQQNFKIKEVPITFVGRQSGTSHVSVFRLSGFKEVYNELKMAILLRLGLY
jgi:glycosyltransferase involved in cell wall biosynthesis